jgi:hypothetical protein
MSDKVAAGASQLISTMNPEPGAMVLPEGDKMVTLVLSFVNFIKKPSVRAVERT